ncbi:sensor histidine kinase [Clostridium polynesiense]|uniref:sensor histidine kinase n=1 Tax=Clostridium polynesiense TaxID=1325933 RepID=UPI0005907F9A|nr:sensor histidine kinase KdpD [Clostridium polynesiense]
MIQKRPNPQELLEKINKIENEQKKGKLKIFFGYAAGVGKTYAMLDAAHTALNNGLDVAVGYIEPHTRPETMKLLNGLEIIPPKEIEYKGMTLKELDIDAALERKPQILIVDELAHSNASGCRHPKRYSDVEELLDAGIDVYTTVNVQHIESLNDIVASITKIIVKERIPDRIFDDAAQVELIDIEPDDLLQRLNQGKIYKEKQAKQAAAHFFTKENLVALREIALRRTADRVNKEVYINKENASINYHTNEHILVCLSSSPSNGKIIRAAARIAHAFHASFTALFVETPDSKELKESNIKQLRANLKHAEELGATISATYGEDVPYEVAEFAKISGISKIILGRANKRTHSIIPKTSFVDRLINYAPDIDVYVIPDKDTPDYKNKIKIFNGVKISWEDSIKMIAILIVCTLIGLYFDNIGFSEANIITIYILGVLVISSKTKGKIYGMVASLIGVLTFNFFFTDPRFTFNAYGAEYPVTFMIMLISAVITSTLTNRVKSQADISAVNAYRTNILLRISEELQKANSLEQIILTSQNQINKLLNKAIIFYTVKDNSILNTYIQSSEDGEVIKNKYTDRDEKAVVSWVIKNKKKAGASTETLPGAKAYYLPLIGQQEVLAVIGIFLENNHSLDNDEKSLLTAILNQISSAIEKYNLNEAQKNALAQAENERFKANLLRAVSHDLRTPLTSISGNANLILSNRFDEESKRKLTLDIYDDALWLINLVENLLSVSRMDNGSVSLKTEPQLVEEIIEEALQHVNRKASEYSINVNNADDLLMVEVDVRLIIQVIINIVDNAIKYTPPGSQIDINCFSKGDKVIMEFADNGSGISDENKKYIFDMFFTVNGNKGDSRRGLGLGLALCKSIIDAHGGSIYIRDNCPKGTVIGFQLKKVEIKNI